MFGGTTVITAAGFRGLRQISRNMSLKKDLEKNSKPEQKCKKKSELCDALFWGVF